MKPPKVKASKRPASGRANTSTKAVSFERSGEWNHESILASAGSGKTFQLSHRYVRLVLDGADPGSILATTFTRAAAGEIRERILTRLADAALNDADRADVAKHTGRASLSRDEAIDALVRLSASLHRLQIRTIDSFFARLVRCFALELGIDPAAEIADPAQEPELRREAIEAMLDERDPQPLIEMLRVLADGGAHRAVTDQIDSAVGNLYDLYREAPAEAWTWIEPRPMLSAPQLVDAIQHLEGTPPTVSDKRFLKAHRDDCERARTAGFNSADDWCKFLTTGMAAKIADGSNAYCSKAIERAVVAAYELLVRHARAVCWNAIAWRTKALHHLLSSFNARFDAVKQRHKALTFSDFPALLAQYPGSPSRGSGPGNLAYRNIDELYFRLDATLHHVLFDEMQDTSVPQWRALSPLVEEILSNAPPQRTFFCVGDVKQSIYGWREGCPEILQNLSERTERRDLPDNWRSSRTVLDVVDRVLCNAAANPALNDHQGAAGQWDEWYEPHVAKKNLPGYVELRIAARPSKDDDERAGDLVLAEAAALVADLHRASPHRPIGVLVRRNKTEGRLLYSLLHEHNVNAAGRGGGSFTDSAAVNAILDLLRLADHPEHTIAAFNVAHSPLGPVAGLAAHPDGRPNLRACRGVSQKVRRQLLVHGYAATIHRWVSEIAPHTDARQLRRLVQLEQLAAQFDATSGGRCDDFVTLAEGTALNDPTAAPVQVMTIHKAKGLEFDIVVLPELDAPLADIKRSNVAYERDDDGVITRIARNVNKDVRDMFRNELDGLFDRYITRTAKESLCVLYVAMTRARHALHMVVKAPHENEKTIPKTLAGVVRSALAPDRAQPGEIVFANGDPDWAGIPALRAGSLDGESEETNPARRAGSPRLAPSAGRTARGRSARAASADHDDAAPLRERLRMPPNDARERGTVIHALFEQIEWLDDGQPDADELVHIALRLAPRRGEAWARQQVESFVAMLERPAVRDLLSRNGRDAKSLRLWREWRFARLVDGGVQQGAIDRLVAVPAGEGFASAMVIDFKTDVVEQEQARERAERYVGQLRAYRAAAAAALGLDEAAVETALLFVHCGEVVR